MNIDAEAIGKNLRELRISHKMTIKEMAEKFGVTEYHWGLVDRGKRLPSLDILIQVCQQFNVSLDSLLSVPSKKQNASEYPCGLKNLTEKTAKEIVLSTNLLKLLLESDSHENIINSQIMGQRLKKVREEKGWTLREAGKHIGINWTYLQMLEKGKNIPRLKVLKQITEIYEITPDYLFAYDLPTGKTILVQEFIEWFNTLTESQQEKAIKFINCYSND